MSDLADYYQSVGFFRTTGLTEAEAHTQAEEAMAHIKDEGRMKWETFAKEFNKVFGPPVFPHGFARAKLLYDDSSGYVLHISIGARDADFLVKTGECVGSGMLIDQQEERSRS